MTVEVKRKKGESIESFMRRFQQRVVQSGVQFRAKQNQFREKKASKRQLKESALRRQTVHSKREYLQKVGKLPLEDKRGGRTNTRKKK